MFYKDRTDLPIYNFDQIARTGNNMFLVRDYDGYTEVEFDEDEANKLWGEIYEDFCKRTNDNASLLYYENLEELGYLKMRKIFVLSLLDQLGRFMTPETKQALVDELAEWKYVIDITQPMEKELQRMARLVRAYDNKIGLLEDEIENMKPDEEEDMSLVKQAVKLARALSRENIDTRKTTVEHWLALMDEAKEANKHKKAA